MSSGAVTAGKFDDRLGHQPDQAAPSGLGRGVNRAAEHVTLDEAAATGSGLRRLHTTPRVHDPADIRASPDRLSTSLGEHPVLLGLRQRLEVRVRVSPQITRDVLRRGNVPAVAPRMTTKARVAAVELPRQYHATRTRRRLKHPHVTSHGRANSRTNHRRLTRNVRELE